MSVIKCFGQADNTPDDADSPRENHMGNRTNVRIGKVIQFFIHKSFFNLEAQNFFLKIFGAQTFFLNNFLKIFVRHFFVNFIFEKNLCRARIEKKLCKR